MQRMQFRAKSAKNDLKPTDFLKHSFSFETEGLFFKVVLDMISTNCRLRSNSVKIIKSKTIDVLTSL
jgi:hypothetical protein